MELTVATGHTILVDRCIYTGCFERTFEWVEVEVLEWPMGGDPWVSAEDLSPITAHFLHPEAGLVMLKMEEERLATLKEEMIERIKEPERDPEGE